MKQIELKKIIIFLIISICCVQINGCCGKKKQIQKKVKTETKKQSSKEDISVPDESAKLIEKTGLSYSINKKPRPVAAPVRAGYSFFEREYLNGVKHLEAGELDKALKIFNDILRQYPEGEEASIAALCIAEVYFRSKNNEAALKLYKEIIKKYPGTQAAQNAAEGIIYLESFSKHENSFVPPEIEDKRRRGR